jgi:large subunit ribosomal protein L17
MFRNMVTSLLEHEKIVTTVPKAKELRGVADRVITYAKKGTLHHRRLAARYVRDSGVLHTVFTDYAERFRDRPGGYTRITRLGWRRGDAAEMAIIQLIPEGEPVTKAKKRRKATAAAEAAGPVTSKETFEEEAAAADAETPAAESEVPSAEAAPAVEADAAPAADEKADD